MGSHKTISASSYPTPTVPVPPPVADYNVSGVLVPDCSCNYFLAGIYGASPYYRRGDGLYYLWKHLESSLWHITTVLGVISQPIWIGEFDIISSHYMPVPPTLGVASVSAGPH